MSIPYGYYISRLNRFKFVVAVYCNFAVLHDTFFY
nr:MAG TPA: hypothetical protein [Caudoviricetes sp.]